VLVCDVMKISLFYVSCVYDYDAATMFQMPIFCL
jgi:hypothetical protein